jgi:23S rRNA pseudouridine1911/1915/1917 synthase
MGLLHIENFIRYEDKSILVVWKTAGLAVERRKVTETDLEGLLREYLAARGERPEIFIIQRLDQPVEGLLVFAKTKKAAANLTTQMQKGEIRKIYRAKVEGEIPKEEDELRDYLQKNAKLNRSEVVPAEQAVKKERNQSRKRSNAAKLAVLKYRKLNEDEVEVKLETGRHHQIRVQLAHAGMPIRGDRKYGAKTGGQLCLASCHLEFRHPDSGRKMEFSATPTFE